jgi:multiple sugar transport system substrate-binding protein
MTTTATKRPASRPGGGLTRSELLRRAGVGGAALVVGGSAVPTSFAGPLRFAGRLQKGTISVVQWEHVVPAYDAWLNAWAARWGERNDVAVEIDRVPYTRLPTLAASEAKAGKGHDIFGFLSPPAAYEDDVLDHRDVVAEVERAVGPYGSIGKRSTYNPKTKKYFGVSDSFVPSPTLWRHDVWQSIGESPATWEHVRSAAPKLRELRHPVGIGQSGELDSNVALTSLLMCFGSFLQTAGNVPAIDTKASVEAVRFVADLWKSGQDARVFSWSAASNNQFLLSGEGSLVMNAISALRTAELLELPFAPELWVWPVPAGPAARLALGQYTSVYSIWKWARSPDAAQRFLADLCTDARQATEASAFFSYPSFPNAFPAADLYKLAAAHPSEPKGKYSILTTVALEHTRNPGYPGTANAAVMEAFSRNLVPYMFARVSQGKATAEDSVAMTAWELKKIWRKWKAAGKV